MTGSPLIVRPKRKVQLPMKKYNPVTAAVVGFGLILKQRGVFAAIAFALLMLGMGDAHAALDTNITGIVTDLTTFFGSIQTLTISVVVFGLAIGYAKLLGRK